MTRELNLKPHNLAEPIIPELLPEYQEKTKIGIHEAKNKKVIFTGICRNVEDNVKNVLNFCDDIEDLFGSVDYFFYENDSEDSTKAILNEWSQLRNNRTVLSETGLYKKFSFEKDPVRLKNISNARNKYLDYINIRQTQYDYVIVLDMDLRYISIDGFFNSLGWLESTDINAMAGFSFLYKIFKDTEDKTHVRLINFDSYAFRHNYWTFVESTSWFNDYIPLIGSRPYKVNSAFGGSCIYKYSDFVKARYHYFDCEHVEFHRKLKLHNNDFNLFVNPSQICYIGHD